MTVLSIVGIAGSICGDARLFHAVERLARASGEEADAAVEIVDYCSVNGGVRSARFRTELDDSTHQFLSAIESADALVIGIPFERGSIPGVFKHLFDLADPDALAGKPVLTVARSPADAQLSAFHRHVSLFLESIGAKTVEPTLLFDKDEVGRDGTADIRLADKISSPARHLRQVLLERGTPLWHRRPAGNVVALRR
ncbi:NADPH-dependent FMN reductase [Chthonobacter albigriseus]|uniref:NADPH-dependent FMN reductase n=1 Tax=Chthonobacter albigriseus TaxID=1683161 RepID=UPI0015EF2FB8|nr:NAD(P)H-dependent oxidoreductase [Chthonobacter albigriseus]